MILITWSFYNFCIHTLPLLTFPTGFTFDSRFIFIMKLFVTLQAHHSIVLFMTCFYSGNIQVTILQLPGIDIEWKITRHKKENASWRQWGVSYCKPFGAACALVLITWLSSCTNAPYCWCDPSQTLMLQSHIWCHRYLVLHCFPLLIPFELILCASSCFFHNWECFVNFFCFSHMLSFGDLPLSFMMSVKVERLCGQTVSIGWELCRIHIVLAHALLSAGITGAVRLHSKLQV